MPVELSIVETVTELETTVVEVVLESSSTPGPAGPGVPAGGTTGQRLAKASDTDFDTEWTDAGTPGLHASSHEDGGADEISLAGLSGTPAALTTHEADTTNVHGIADTSALETTTGAQTKVDAHVNDATAAHAATAIAFTPDGSIAATTVQAAIVEVRDEAGGGGAPTDVDYLVGTASGGLSNEIVVGATPGGELGGTWASPTVDASHSGSTHAAVQAAAEATAAAALSAHLTDAVDAHDASAISVDSTTLVGTGTDAQAVFEELDNAIVAAEGVTADHIADATAAHAGSAISVDSTNLSGVGTTVQASLEELDNLLDDHSARHEDGGADEISIQGLAGTPTELTNHLNDATDAHDASAISVLDTAGDYTATDVEGVLAEIAPQLGGGAGAMELIEVDVLGSAGTFDFDSIPGTYSHLMLVFILRTTANSGALATATFNADSGNNYDRVSLTNLNTTVSGAVGTIPTSGALLTTNALAGTTDPAGRATHGRMFLFGYSGTTFHKDWLAEAHSSVSEVAGGQGLAFVHGTWENTDAITRIQIVPNAGSTFVTGSTVWLYGIA